MNSPQDTSWIHKGRVPCLDGVRGISIILVIFGHSTYCSHKPIPVPTWTYRSIGWAEIGVDLFFVLSGFLITLLMIRENNRTGGISLRDFYRRRILRIMPAYVAFLLIVSFLHLAGVLTINSKDWQGALTYTMNFYQKRGWELGHFWSLSVEEHFYLIWPVVLALLGLTAGRWSLVLCILAAPLLRFWSQLHWSSYFSVQTASFNYADVIAFGAALAFLCQDDGFLKRTARLQPVCGWLIIGVCLGLVGSARLSDRFDQYEILCHRTITGSLCAALIYLCAGYSNKLARRILSWRPLMFLGVVSYSAYVWQQLFTGKSTLPSWMCTWPLNILFIGTAAVLSYQLIEKPFINMKERSSRHVDPQPVPLVAELCSVGTSCHVNGRG
jgi:peptidoglycan/LPS O-acetylase OafA/YrhL